MHRTEEVCLEATLGSGFQKVLNIAPASDDCHDADGGHAGLVDHQERVERKKQDRLLGEILPHVALPWHSSE